MSPNAAVSVDGSNRYDLRQRQTSKRESAERERKSEAISLTSREID